jgi:hypothetical protein
MALVALYLPGCGRTGLLTTPGLVAVLGVTLEQMIDFKLDVKNYLIC